MIIRKIVFFYPSRIVGGMEMLFLRLSDHLSKKEGFNIGYVDFEDGFVANQLNKNIKHYKFNYNKIILSEDTVLVAPLSSIKDITAYFHPHNIRVLLWSVHPEGLKSAIDNWQRYLFQKKGLNFFANDLDNFIKKKGLFFMDGENFHRQKKYFSFNENSSLFLPIFAEDKVTRKKYYSNSIIKMGSLGRLSLEKVMPIINVLEECNDYLSTNESENIDFHIIGEGEEFNRLKEFKANKRLRLIFVGNLLKEDMDNYLVKNVDVLFAMGTSALEGASLGVATVLLDYSFESMSDNKRFQWLFESEEFSLGRNFSKDNNYKHSFHDICSYIKSGDIADYGKKCLTYFEDNHRLNVTSDLFVRAIDKTDLEIDDLKNSKFKIFNKIYALKKMIKRLVK